MAENVDALRPTRAEIDLGAIRRNVTALKSLLHNGAKFCAVVKADGYGHGAVPVSRAALEAGADALAVAIPEEGVRLREGGITAPVVVLGSTPPEQAEIIVKHNLEPTIYSKETAARISDAAKAADKTVRIHLKIDTGMTRLGVRPDEAAAFACFAAALPGIEVYGAYTHFAAADSADPEYTRRQLALFNRALADIENAGVRIRLRHAANSAALLSCPDSHFDMVRAGIAVYGLWPSEETVRPVRLEAAMRLKTRVTMVKNVPPGTAVSYGCRYVTAGETTRIATLPVGYADGFSRLLSGKARARIAGTPVPIVGTICMDQCMADVTGVGGVEEGTEALLFGGPDLPVEEVARALGTINYEVVCMVGKRVPRVYVES